MPSRLNGGFEIGSAKFGQLTTNLYYSLIHHEHFKHNGHILQKQYGMSARYSYYMESWSPFFSLAYTHLITNIIPDSLLHAAIGVRYISNHLGFECRINIPDLIKLFYYNYNRNTSTLESIPKYPICLGIQIKLHHDDALPNDWRQSISRLPERYIPYPAYLAATDLFFWRAIYYYIILSGGGSDHDWKEENQDQYLFSARYGSSARDTYLNL